MSVLVGPGGDVESLLLRTIGKSILESGHEEAPGPMLQDEGNSEDRATITGICVGWRSANQMGGSRDTGGCAQAIRRRMIPKP